MVKVAKVFIWISIILMFWTIITPIIGVIALKKIKNANSKDDLTMTAVLVLIFVNTISGILLLLAKDEDLAAAK